MDDVQLCVFCVEKTMPGDNMNCDSCSEFYHFECCQIFVDRQAGMLKLIEFLGWTCRACRFVAASNHGLLKQSIADLSSELKTLRASFPGAVAPNKNSAAPTRIIATTSWQTTGVPIVPKDPYIPSTNNHPSANDPVNMRITQPHTDSPYSLDNITKAVSKTICDASWKFFFIVSGLGENEEGISKDGYMFSELCKYELGLEIQSEMWSTKRLGKTMPGLHDRPRRHSSFLMRGCGFEDLAVGTFTSEEHRLIRHKTVFLLIEI